MDTDKRNLRLDLISRVLGIVRADAERGDGRLKRSDLQRQCFKKNLSIVECLAVETALQGMPIVLVDDLIEAAEQRGGESPKKGARNFRFLSELEEKELGRQIQLALRLKRDGGSGNPGFDDKLLQQARRATNRFVETNLLFVRQLAERWGPRKHLSTDDLFQEGVLGLLRATETLECPANFVPVRDIRNWHERSLYGTRQEVST
jgi:RNA polymerase primary sigma factor